MKIVNNTCILMAYIGNDNHDWVIIVDNYRQPAIFLCQMTDS